MGFEVIVVFTRPFSEHLTRIFARIERLLKILPLLPFLLAVWRAEDQVGIGQ